MEERIEKNSVCNTASNDSVHSLLDDLLKINEPLKKLEDVESLSFSLSAQYKEVFENNVPAETSKLCDKYFSAAKRIKNNHEKYSSAAMKYHTEEIKMKNEIRELERKLNSTLKRNQILSEDNLALQKQKIATQEALCLAKKYYTSVWDMNIHIKDSKEDKFTCIINFKFDCGMYPIEFVIDRNNQEIINWNAGALLTTEEEKEMKDRYSTTDYYFPHVLSELRLIAMNKIKMS